MINTTPLHSRAAQLALIRRWIAMEVALLERVAGRTHAERLVKSRIITDIISFCDCLVTRPVPAGAPQAMDGLDVLVRAIGLSPKALTAFIAKSNFQAELDKTRMIRDAMGGHVEIDENETVTMLTARVDGFSLSAALDLYHSLEALFISTCRSHPALGAYVADGQRIYGATTAAAPAQPFRGAPAAGPQAPPPRLAINDAAEMGRQLARWLGRVALEREEARHYFFEAFGHSAEIDTLREDVELGSGIRHEQHAFRQSHVFILDTLSKALSDREFERILELMAACRGGWPYGTRRDCCAPRAKCARLPPRCALRGSRRNWRWAARSCKAVS